MSDPLEAWEREVIGDAVRVHLPIRDKADVLRASAILRELSNRLEAIAKSRDGEFTALLRMRTEAKAANARLKSKPRRDSDDG